MKICKPVLLLNGLAVLVVLACLPSQASEPPVARGSHIALGTKLKSLPLSIAKGTAKVILLPIFILQGAKDGIDNWKSFE